MQNVSNMVSIKTWLTSLVFATITFLGFSQEKVNMILEGYKNTVKNEQHFKVDITYKIYKGHESTTPNEVKSGEFYRNGKEMYTKIDEVEILNAKEAHIKANHVERAILLADPFTAPQEVNMDLTELFTYLNAKLVQNTANYWSIEFTPKGAITQVPFSKLNVKLEKSSYRLLEQTFFYFQEMNFSRDQKKSNNGQVKLSVSFKGYQKLDKGTLDSIFDWTKYVVKVNGKYKVANTYKGYELVNIKK